MQTHETGTLIALACAGLVSGLASFSGLWWGLRRTVERQRHAAWAIASMAARFGFLAAVFWIAARGDSMRLATVLAGFLVAQAMALGFGFSAARAPGKEGRSRR